ncbi:MAG TPA: 8-amino-7-oxononanoate synthase [Gammaproteobacteria bacterium]|nr:8-amino-7-oxononanoate synthase [Gammaproteobacteria bacterium]
MTADLDAALRAALDEAQARHLRRARLVVEGATAVETVMDGERVLAFCSNDYLGLANHPAVRAALLEGVQRYGVGSGASHLVTGHGRAHEALEEALAAFTGRPRALLFSTGYMANLGVVGALAGRGDHVFEDRLNHASLLDAGRLAQARLHRYAHADAAALEHRLATTTGAGRKLVVTDGVFSMDGDLAPLPALAAAARAYGAWLMVDDAHGLGVLGPEGRGTLAHFGLGMAEVPILMGTLGKAFGTFGAFVAGSEALIETLIQRARTYLYTTALPPALAVATRAALEVAQRESWRRTKLAALVARFRAGAARRGLPLAASATPIQPLIVGDAARALALAQALRRRGILVVAIRPPTVPVGRARLRITFCAEHTEAQVDRLLEALEESLAALRESGSVGEASPQPGG